MVTGVTGVAICEEAWLRRRCAWGHVFHFDLSCSTTIVGGNRFVFHSHLNK